MHRFFLSQMPDEKGRVMIEDAGDVHHLLHVLRMTVGDTLEVVTGGQVYLGKIQSADQVIELLVERRKGEDRESPLEITLFQGLCKGEKMEWVLQKGVELGLSHLVPLRTKRAVVQLDEKKAEKKRQRWQRIADEAAKQSKRTRLPSVHLPVDVSGLLERLGDYDLVLLAYEKESEQQIKAVLAGRERPVRAKVALVVGPEGGFEEEEISILEGGGAQVVGLGPRILRTETAPLVLMTLLGAEWGDLS